MADLGAIGTSNTFQRTSTVQWSGRQCLRIGTELFNRRLTKDASDGDPAPSMQIRGPHRFQFFWEVEAGARTIQIRCKYAPDLSGHRPRLVVKANVEVGVTSDSAADASSGTGYEVVGPISVSPTVDGVLLCELQFDHILDPSQIAHWDTIEVT